MKYSTKSRCTCEKFQTIGQERFVELSCASSDWAKWLGSSEAADSVITLRIGVSNVDNSVTWRELLRVQSVTDSYLPD